MSAWNKTAEILKDIFTEKDGETWSHARFAASGLGFTGLLVVVAPVIHLIVFKDPTAQDWATLLTAEALMFPTVAAGVWGTLKSE